MLLLADIMACVEEQTTKHHLGAVRGHGCVQSTENVVMGIFGSSKLLNGRLTPLFFDRRQLARGNVSFARETFTTRQVFEDHVIRPKQIVGDPFRGLIRCNVQKLRDVNVKVPGAQPPQQIRGICVLDQVDPGDFDGHGTLKYSEEQVPFSQTRISAVRDIVAADLVNLFNGILMIDSVFPLQTPAAP